jgi:uncharacterized membrane protein
MPTKTFLNAWYAKPLRIAHVHIKLSASAAVGVVVFVLLPSDWLGATRLLIAWNVAVALYLVTAWYIIARFELSRMRRRAETEDEGAALILVLTVAAAAASLGAIFVDLAAVRQAKSASGWYVGLALSTVVLSWTFIHVIYAFHYAHDYYGGLDKHKGGLEFPRDDRPEYWDFVYFSFVIGMTFQVSDVQVTSKALRRVVIGHGAVSFFYNVAVLALMVNIGGEMIKGS